MANTDTFRHQDDTIIDAFSTKFARDRWPKVCNFLSDPSYSILSTIMRAMATEGLIDEQESELCMIDLTVSADERLRNNQAQRELADELELLERRPTTRKKLSRDQMSLIGWLDEQLPRPVPMDVWTAQCGLTSQYIRKARSLYAKKQIPQIPSFINCKHLRRQTGGLRMKSQLQKAYCDLFKENTFNLSGDRTTTRILALTQYEMDAKRYAEYPRILRGLWDDEPELRFVKVGSRSTQLQTDMDKAMRDSFEVGFDEETERQTRENDWLSKYRTELATRRIAKHQSSVTIKWEADMEKDLSAVFQRTLRGPHPCTRSTFKKVLKANGLKYKTKVNETRYCYSLVLTFEL